MRISIGDLAAVLIGSPGQNPGATGVTAPQPVSIRSGPSGGSPFLADTANVQLYVPPSAQPAASPTSSCTFGAASSGGCAQPTLDQLLAWQQQQGYDDTTSSSAPTTAGSGGVQLSSAYSTATPYGPDLNGYYYSTQAAFEAAPQPTTNSQAASGTTTTGTPPPGLATVAYLDSSNNLWLLGPSGSIGGTDATLIGAANESTLSSTALSTLTNSLAGHTQACSGYLCMDSTGLAAFETAFGFTGAGGVSSTEWLLIAAGVAAVFVLSK